MKVSSDPNGPNWTENLPGERARIVRLCARLTGSYDAAEDLAQETLYEAWRLAANLREQAAWRGFVTGIARNVCWRHLRGRSREDARRAVVTNVGGGFSGDGGNGASGGSAEWDRMLAAADPFDMELALEREERADLLDRAMGALAPPTRRLLFERYIDDLPPSEIARRWQVNENVVGVRMHRARAAFRRVLETTPALAAEAAAYGLISLPPTPGSGGHSDAANIGWQETRIWCPRCGNARLEGRFEQGDATDSSSQATPETLDNPKFAVRCRECRDMLGFDFSTGHRGLDSLRLLHGISGYKPALSRLSAWWTTYFDTARSKRDATCPQCGRRARTLMTSPRSPDPLGVRGMYVACDHCEGVCVVSPSGIVFHRPEAQAFWRRHPRMSLASERDIVFEGRSAVVVTLVSLTSSERLEVILDRADFSPLTK